MQKTEGVRIGPVSLATLISILLLAVLAMLCVTTSNAAQAMAERQANSATETYALDSCGQHMLASISAEFKSSGSMDSVASKLSSIADKAKDASSLEKANIATSKTKNGVTFVITTETGKTLNAKVSQSNGSLSVDQWKLSTTQQESEETLWSGSGDNE